MSEANVEKLNRLRRLKRELINTGQSINADIGINSDKTNRLELSLPDFKHNLIKLDLVRSQIVELKERRLDVGPLLIGIFSGQLKKISPRI